MKKEKTFSAAERAFISCAVQSEIHQVERFMRSALEQADEKEVARWRKEVALGRAILKRFDEGLLHLI